MTMHNYAENSKFGDLIKKMREGEVNGSQLYFVLIYLAREKGYDDLAEAMLKNACEDAIHGGMYGAMLGKGNVDDEKFWRQVVNLYKLEAGANETLGKMADEVRTAGEDRLADCIAATIPEENEHAARLVRVFEARGIAYK